MRDNKTNITHSFVEAVEERYKENDDEEEKDKGESQDLFLNFRNSEIKAEETKSN